LKEARVYADGRGTSGVALPDLQAVQPCAVVTSEFARRLGAQLILAADEHDAIADAAVAQFGPPMLGEAAQRAERVAELRSALVARLDVVASEHDRAALQDAVRELAELLGGRSA
jgi:hypothetical protein